MKRFVTELANHALKPYEKEPEKHELAWERISAAVRYCERGMITENRCLDMGGPMPD